MKTHIHRHKNQKNYKSTKVTNRTNPTFNKVKANNH